MQNAAAVQDSTNSATYHPIDYQSITRLPKHRFAFGMSFAQPPAVTVAMPIWEGRASPVLDVAGRFLVCGEANAVL